MGSCKKRNSTRPTRVTDPHDEQATVRNPREGSGSVAVADEVARTASAAGVADE